MNSNAISDLHISPEWELLEMLCEGLHSQNRKQTFEHLLRKNQQIDWGELLDQAIRHRMAYIFIEHLTSDHSLSQLVPRYIRYFLINSLHLNQHKTEIFRDGAVKIITAFEQMNIPIVATKGIAFESNLYKGKGIRPLGDMDFMINPENNHKAQQIMTELGYQVGHFDRTRNEIIPHTRRDMLLYKLNPDHLPKFVQLTNDRFARHLSVDFSNTFTWTNSDYSVPLNKAFAELVYQPIPGFDNTKMPVFQPEYNFIFTILHFFREAWLVRDLTGDKDVNLIKCSDVLRFWRNNSIVHTSNFMHMLQEFDIIQPVLWVLEHIDRTFDTNIIKTLQIQTPVSEEWLTSANSGGKILSWQGTMRERLFCKTRKHLFLRIPS